MFDMDDSGQAAVQDCLSLPLNTRASQGGPLPEKDPNEELMAGNSKGIIDGHLGSPKGAAPQERSLAP